MRKRTRVRVRKLRNPRLNRELYDNFSNFNIDIYFLTNDSVTATRVI